MKHLSSKVFLLVLSFLLIFSCDNQDNTISGENSKDGLLSKEQIADIGKKHNEALAEALNNLKNSNVSFKNSSKSKVIQVANKGLNEYYAAQYSGEALNSAIQFSEENVFKYTNSVQTRSEEKRSASSAKEFTEKNKSKLSKQQIELFLQLDKILDNKNKTDLQTILRQLEKLGRTAKSSLSKEEAQIILVTVEVAKNSCIYWEENMEKWIKILTDKEIVKTKSKSWFSWGDVGKADALGAAGGATYAAVVNAIPGAGQAGYLGSIAGGAAGNSTISALEQVWDHYF